MGTIEIPYLIIYYLAPVNPRVIYACLANGQIVVMASSQIQPYYKTSNRQQNGR